MKLGNRGNLSLIGLLAAVAIIAIVAAFYFGKSGGVATVKSDSPLLDKSSQKQTLVGKSLDTVAWGGHEQVWRLLEDE